MCSGHSSNLSAYSISHVCLVSVHYKFDWLAIAQSPTWVTSNLNSDFFVSKLCQAKWDWANELQTSARNADDKTTRQWPTTMTATTTFTFPFSRPYSHLTRDTSSPSSSIQRSLSPQTSYSMIVHYHNKYTGSWRISLAIQTTQTTPMCGLAMVERRRGWGCVERHVMVFFLR